MVQINGKPVENAAGLTLSAYLNQAGYQPCLLYTSDAADD